MSDLPKVRKFIATESYDIKGRGTLYCGRCPFTWDKSLGLSPWTGPWMILHPKLDPATMYRVTSVESYALQIIREGSDVGVLIEEIPTEPTVTQ